ncbi:hypothetical protein Theco_4066 (plasmid) [Thermobacillus composti KWC4]|uniref:Uncharacterized protein n=1 Tax=Thermobacillus composti (strain DSM 18247 / JCM 13945 / KWC4) TaxID=717605 RepID=L0EJU9_THECK|nr:type II toxin-antitoxin system HicB family antitoxin [Thermobacillus composti]AGA60066.1 hypothetical protein Theco_4066 [Thermobacillus composti KWC4]
MEKILVFEGTKVEMQEKARGYYQSIRGLVLWETGREITVTFAKYGGVRARFQFNALFSGAAAQFIVAIENANSGLGVLCVYEGDWDSRLAMSYASRFVTKCFPSTTDKQKRGILKELGELMYTVLTEFDSLVVERFKTKELTAEVRIDSYEVLTDIEWIEQIMDESAVGTGISSYRVLIERNIGDSEYVAYIPALRLGAMGRDLEEALQEASALLKESISEAINRGLPLPRDNSFIDILRIDTDALHMRMGDITSEG